QFVRVRPARSARARVLRRYAGEAGARCLIHLADVEAAVAVWIRPRAVLEGVEQRVHARDAIDADLQAVAAVARLQRRPAVADRIVGRAGAPHGDALIDHLRLVGPLCGTARAAR